MIRRAIHLARPIADGLLVPLRVITATGIDWRTRLRARPRANLPGDAIGHLDRPASGVGRASQMPMRQADRPLTAGRAAEAGAGDRKPSARRCAALTGRPGASLY